MPSVCTGRLEREVIRPSRVALKEVEQRKEGSDGTVLGRSMSLVEKIQNRMV
jgi:hypothetical protein